MIGAIWKLIIFTSMVKRLIDTSRNERVTLPVYDTCLQMFLFFGLWRKDCLTRSTLSSDTRGRPALFSFTNAPRCLKLLISASNAIGRWGITAELSPVCPLKRKNWFVLHKLQHTKRLLLRSGHYRFVTSQTERVLHRPRGKRRVGLRMHTKLEHLLFRSMWETYFCVRFENRNGRLKLLQSFWYTLYIIYRPILTKACIQY
jgi:hypothetical protein